MNNKPNRSIVKNDYLLNSYSQSGEDRIVNFLLKSLKLQEFTYLDVGAYHPYHLSNTALFYGNGYRGINIEPDPILFKQFEKNRPEDTNLNIGISNKEGEFIFYKMSIPTLNTFSKEEAKKNEKFDDIKIIEEIKIKTYTIDSILKKYCKGMFPDFLSLDVEGLDLQILKTINYKSNKPKIICVESIPFENGEVTYKNDAIIRFLKDHGYMYYADTFINSIFVDKKLWENR